MTLSFLRPALSAATLAAMLAATVAATLAAPARAERADANKPIVIDARSLTRNDVTGTTLLVGNVEVQRGTLLIKSGRATMKTDPQGYTFAVFYADPGALATFRQKRDGGDIWDEGEAERIEYDTKAEVVKLFSKAKVTTIENKRKANEVQGAYLSYNTRTEVASGENDVSGVSKPDGGRVRIVIEPNVPPAPAPAKKP